MTQKLNLSPKLTNSCGHLPLDPQISLFDDTTPIKSLWETYENITKAQCFILREKTFLMKASFSKKTESSQNWKQRKFYLHQDYLSYKKKDKSLGKIMLFDIVKVQFQDDHILKKEVPFAYRFIFMKNRDTCIIATNKQEVYYKWKEVLATKCILNTFHRDFQVVRMIGKGSFAKVFLARKNDSQKEVAIKAFSKDALLAQEKGRNSILNEIQIMRKMDHNQIIRLYEVHETDHSLYLVLERLQGGELFKKMKEKHFYSQDDISKIMKNLLEALDHVHSHKIMHRDLKLENLLLRNEKDIDVVVIDFGLASSTELSAKEVLFKRCGTPGFVAPEVLLYKDATIEEFYNEKCDIFSVGVIFYILLTGRKPFTGSDYKEILKANRDCKVDYENEDLKKLNENIFEFLKQLLSPLPVSRPSAKEALNNKFFDKIRSNEGDLIKKNSFLNKFEEEEKSLHFEMKNYSIGKFSYTVKNSSTLKDSVDLIANDLTMNKPYCDKHKSEEMHILTDLQSFTSNFNLDSPKKKYSADLNNDSESPKKFSKFSCKNEFNEFPGPYVVNNKQMKSAANPNELHKYAIINTMKEKINEGPTVELQVPDENSPLSLSIKKYESFEAKSKNL